jgi:hypothetical protein
VQQNFLSFEMIGSQNRESKLISDRLGLFTSPSSRVIKRFDTRIEKIPRRIFEIVMILLCNFYFLGFFVESRRERS